MKVCFLNLTLDEAVGAGRFGANLIQALYELDPGLEVQVLTSMASGHPLEAAILPQSAAGWFYFLPKLRRLCAGFDIVHALDGYPYGAFAALALMGFKKKFMITAIGTGAIQPFSQSRGWLMRLAYRRADKVCAVSRYTRREILTRLPRLAVQVIPHGVRLEDFPARAFQRLDKETQSRIRGLRPYMLSVGAPKARKGFFDSLRAFAKLRERFPALNYVLIGNLKEFLAPLIRDLHLEDAVHIFPRVDQNTLAAFYQNAELFMLLPYDDAGDVEGFGLVFLEAAAAGIPVIGTYQSGAEEAVADGQNGFLVLPKNSAAAAEKAAAILTDRVLGERFCRGSLALAKEMSWQRAAKSYLAIYRELLKTS